MNLSILLTVATPYRYYVQKDIEMRLCIEMRLSITTCQDDRAVPPSFRLYLYVYTIVVYTINSGRRVFVCRCPFDYVMSHTEMICLHIHVYHIEMQLAATHCNTLQHTATHCNTLHIHVYHIEIRLCIFMLTYSCNSCSRIHVILCGSFD